jgi:hypothetical protein
MPSENDDVTVGRECRWPERRYRSNEFDAHREDIARCGVAKTIERHATEPQH